LFGFGDAVARDREYEEMLLVKAAWYYYMEGLTQQQIAEYLGISRLKVNHLLDKARQNGTVQFSVRIDAGERMKLEKSLVSIFHLKDAFVVPAPVNPDLSDENAAQAAAMFLADRIQPGDYINVGYGKTISSLLNRLANNAEYSINMVSLTGGVNNYLPNTQSSIFNARLFLMPSPLLVRTPEMVRNMMDEPDLQQIMQMSKLAKATVFGIGAMNPGATVLTNGLLSNSDFLLLSMRGAVGDILCHYIDAEGKIVDSDIENRLISTSLEHIRGLENTIAVAAGAPKVDAIRAVLRGGYTDVLITDEATAQSIVSREIASKEQS